MRSSWVRLNIVCGWVWVLGEDTRVPRDCSISNRQACCQLLRCWALSLNLEQRVLTYWLNPRCTCLSRESGELGGVGRNLAPLERRKVRWSF